MRTVITYGTFDLFHRGHYNILKRAKEEGDYLIVGVTGETYDSERGKLSVQDSLATRISNVEATGFADKIIVEEYLGQKISDIIKYHVDVLVIGSDWKGKFDHLSKYCEVKYLERTKDISSTQLRQETMTIYRLGIVSDDVLDRDCIKEAESVSGIHAESVFAEDIDIAHAFRDRYELFGAYDNYDEFLDSADIVYVKTCEAKRLEYVEKALEAGKHVITDMPYTTDEETSKRINALAAEKNVALIENVSMLYQHAFGQLLWMARGNLIGSLISIRCVMSREQFEAEPYATLNDLAYYPICAIVKILGTDFESVHPKLVYDDKGNVTHCLIHFNYENAVATAEVYDDLIQDGITIVGTDGTITVPDDWWRVGYFWMKQKSDKKAKRYCSNFDGNGFRYLVQAALREIRLEEGYNVQITEEEGKTIIGVLNMLEA